MRVDTCLLKLHPNPKKVLDVLLNNEWETAPEMDINFVINNIDNFYYIFKEREDLSQNETVIGFIVYNKERGELKYFELLPQHQKKGYCKYIMSKDMFDHIRYINCDQERSEIWKKIFTLDDEDECTTFIYEHPWTHNHEGRLVLL